MGDVIPFDQRHSLNAKYHRAFGVERAKANLRLVLTSQLRAIDAELDGALAHLMDTQSDEIDLDERRHAITRYTLAVIRHHEQGGEISA